MRERLLSYAARLHLEAAIMAGRLARLLEHTGAAEAAGGAVPFLRSLADAALAANPDVNAGEPAAGRRPDDAPHPIDALVDGLRLQSLEVDLLLLAGLPEEHEGLSATLRALHPRSEPRPSVGLAAQLLCGDPEERALLRLLLGGGAATRAGLLVLSGDVPFFERTLQLADGIWPVLHGVDLWPAALRPCPLPDAFGLDAWLEAAPARRAARALTEGRPCTVLVTAEDEETAWSRAGALVSRSGRRAAAVRPRRGVDPAEAESLLSLHALARGSIPVLRVAPPEPGTPALPLSVLGTHPGPAVVCGRPGAPLPADGRTVLVVPADPLPHAARTAIWRRALPELDGDAVALAERCAVEPAQAQAAALDARAAAALEDRPLAAHDVTAAVAARSGLALAAGIRLLQPSAGWEDLVLSSDRKAQLREAVDRLLHQDTVLDGWRFLEGRPGARGVRMLFAGPSGTGKTLAAEVVASALGVPLLLVDLARVVSKWIGETEKNLAEVFAAAERAHAVLFFDEADALFGKRTEVSDAHDRYANLETAYLLMRLERFEGLAVLSTNLRQNIDSAFLRRLEAIVEFEEPTQSERVALWKAHLPAGAPLAPDVSIAELATLFPVVGGVIRNASVAAAFLAAAEGTPIHRAHFVRALRREYEKSGRAFPGATGGLAVS